MALTRDEFTSAMLRMHAANSSRKWRLLIKNAKMEKSDLTLSTYVQYIEDFRFWMNDVFPEDMYSRTFDTLDDVIREAREDLFTYRDILEISDTIKNWIGLGIF